MARGSGRNSRQREYRLRSKFTPDDPEGSEAQLKRTLAELGLYAAHTTGDGNCLFRALADQLYGDPRLHDKVRKDICDYLEANASYYQNFLLDAADDDLAAHFASHLSEMRQSGVYGDDMELTAFSKMTGREIHIVQPGLVYVVADNSPAKKGKAAAAPIDVDLLPPPMPLSGRERRKAARAAKGKAKAIPIEDDDDSEASAPAVNLSNHPLWIVYHAYEHYSSARNVSGPHNGLPLTEPRTSDGGASDSTPSLTDDSDDNSSDSPSADERLLLQSLPAGSQYESVSAARALIAEHQGSWELALEAAIAEAHGERKRSASPTLPEGSSPRQRMREESDDESSEEVEEELRPPRDHGRPRSRRSSGLLAPPRETRAQMRDRVLKQNTKVTRSKANTSEVEKQISYLRV